MSVSNPECRGDGRLEVLLSRLSDGTEGGVTGVWRSAAVRLSVFCLLVGLTRPRGVPSTISLPPAALLGEAYLPTMLRMRKNNGGSGTKLLPPIAASYPWGICMRHAQAAGG
eukprot:SAG11_NODE_2524_length_3260_cov_1.524518_2_plen_112_part_00